MDNNNFTQNNNQNNAGLQNIAQQDVYPQGMNPQGMYQQNMVQQNVYQQTMNGQGMGQQNTYQQDVYQQEMYQQNTYQQGVYQQGMYQQGIYQQNMHQQSLYQQGNQVILTRKEFAKLPQLHKIKHSIMSSVFLLYFVAGINFLIGIEVIPYALGEASPWIFADVAYIFFTGLFLQLTYRRIFAILTLGYGLLNMIVFLINLGQMGGILVIIAGTLSLLSTFALDKAWKEYLKTGRLPDYLNYN